MIFDHFTQMLFCEENGSYTTNYSELLNTATMGGQIARFLRKRTDGEDATGRSSVQS
jgi:hypothetical protein